MSYFGSTDRTQQKIEEIERRLSQLELQGGVWGTGSTGFNRKQFVVYSTAEVPIVLIGEVTSTAFGTTGLNTVDVADDAGAHRMRVGELSSTGRFGMEVYSTGRVVEMRTGKLESSTRFGVEMRNSEGNLVELRNHLTPEGSFVTSSTLVSSTSYTGSGPSVTAEVGPSRRAIVMYGSFIDIFSTNDTGFVSFKTTGASTITADDNRAYIVGWFDAGNSTISSRIRGRGVGISVLVSPTLSSGSNTFTLQYRTLNGSTITFEDPQLLVWPI